jgi:hypothetical protein
MRNTWKAFFAGLDTTADNTTKKAFLKKQVLLFGKNHQEGPTGKEKLEAGIKKANEFIAKIKPKEDEKYKGPVDQLKKTFSKAFSIFKP